MSDDMRKGLGEQTKEKVKPDSQKSYTEVASENLSGAADKVAGAVQPEDSKSTTQKLGDSTRSNADSAQDSGASLVDKARDVASSATQYAADTLNSASKSISDAISSATDSIKGTTEEAKTKADEST